MGTPQIFLGNVGVPSSLGLTPPLEGSQEAELVVFVLVPQEHVCWSNNNTRHLFCMASCVGKTLLFFFCHPKEKKAQEVAQRKATPGLQVRFASTRAARLWQSWWCYSRGRVPGCIYSSYACLSFRSWSWSFRSWSWANEADGAYSLSLPLPSAPSGFLYHAEPVVLPGAYIFVS